MTAGDPGGSNRAMSERRHAPELQPVRPRGNRAHAWLSPGFPPPGGGTPAALLEEIFALRPVGWLRRVPGRETFVWPGHPEWIVKRTTGGETRDFWYERLRGGARSAGRREAENLARLGADGLAVPRPLAWVEEERATRHPRTMGRTGRSALVMERVPHAETLRRRLGRSDPAERRRLSVLLLHFVARLHRLGWYHRDLYLQHFILSRSAEGGERLVLIDVGRARHEAVPRRRWMVKDLAGLLHSTPECVSLAERQRFLAGWLVRRGEDGRAARHAWARAIAAKARRLASHRPRSVDVERSREEVSAGGA